MSDSGHQDDPAPGTPEPARLRRRPFGYKRDDVDRALGERDAQVAELRQDIAALWLAFAQHDRMIRTALGSAADEPSGTAAEEPGVPGEAGATGSVGRQLADLDEVLAAIETATHTLERTYGGETGAAQAEDSGPAEAGEAGDPAETTDPGGERGA